MLDELLEDKHELETELTGFKYVRGCAAASCGLLAGDVRAQGLRVVEAAIYWILKFVMERSSANVLWATHINAQRLLCAQLCWCRLLHLVVSERSLLCSQGG